MKQFLLEILKNRNKTFKPGGPDFQIPSLRVSLLSGCNESCFYCHNEGIPKNMTSPIDTGEVLNVIYLLRNYGLKKIKFTGGEPLLYKDIKNLLYKVKHIADISVMITTNGTMLKKRMNDLSPTMVDKISVSLDTLDAVAYRTITGRDLLGEVLSGLEMLKKNGYNVEIDTVLLKGLNTSKKSMGKIINYCAEKGFQLQLIELSDKTGPEFYRKYHIDPSIVLEKFDTALSGFKVNDRQFLNIGGAVATVCRNVTSLCESSGVRCGGLRLLPDGSLRDFFY